MKIIATMHPIDQHRGTVRAEDSYDTDIDDLWEACTNPARLARWIADVSGDLRVGGTFYATFTSSAEGPGRIEACERPHHLLVTMLPGTDDETQIEAWLTTDGDQTHLVVEDRGIPLAEIRLHGAGWQAHLEDLGRSLADQPSSWKQRWDELTPAYATLPIG